MKKDIIKIVVSAILLIIAMTIKFENALINQIIYIVAYVIVGFGVLQEAVENILERKNIR